jgi:outer membrane receptor protein involved in Fe transport
MSKQAVKPLLVAILSAYAAQAISVQAEDVQLEKVEVISTTPLNGIGVPLEHVPAGVQQVKQKDLVKQKSLTLGDYMNQNMLGVNVNETQNNPYQPDVNYHGFTASPLLGTPQGLSVYVDGVRVNEAFGDVVNWDLIPMNAINQMTLIPGSNPLFGLNTLGGAISVQTKSGRTNQGGAVEAYTGSWGRHVLNAEYGGVSEDGSKDFFISGNSFEEDGWRSYSASRVKQLFTKAGWQNEKTSVNVSLSLADNKMRGNGLQAGSLIDSLGYKSNFTVPDQTKNNMAFVNLNLSHYFADEIQLSGNVYYRDVRTKTFNGDLNDDYDDTNPLATNNADCQSGTGTDRDEACSGAINRSRLTQKSYGFTSQLTFSQDFLGLKNQFISGLGYNRGKTKFSQNTEFGLLNSDRGVDGTGEFNALTDQVNLSGVNRTWSVFATDTLSLNPYWHVTASARYNTTKIDNDDKITPSGSGSLTGTHTFNRLNPSLGVNFTPSNQLTVYTSYSESSRAPTSIELGCADETNPCKLPNAMAGDPPLKQVVSKTYDAGLRGFLTPTITWSLGAYHTINTNDIQFLTTASVVNNGSGFFSNISKTKRQGIDASLAGRIDAFSWNLGYSFVQATYESSFRIANQVNTSATQDPITNNSFIQVSKGDYMAGIPKHQLKLGLGYDVTSAWNVGSNIVAFSSQYSRGNENNKDTSSGAKVRGYTVVNLFTNYRFDNGWNIFARVNNLFDREYYSLGMLGQNPIDPATGQFSGNSSNDTFYAPGAPRAGWIGARYDFGAKKSVASYDKD